MANELRWICSMVSHYHDGSDRFPLLHYEADLCIPQYNCMTYLPYRIQLRQCESAASNFLSNTTIYEENLLHRTATLPLSSWTQLHGFSAWHSCMTQLHRLSCYYNSDCIKVHIFFILLIKINTYMLPRNKTISNLKVSFGRITEFGESVIGLKWSSVHGSRPKADKKSWWVRVEW